MIESFLKFFELGLYHILNFDGYDHILFVMIISIPFIFKDWKHLLIFISLFTLGHSISLLLGVYDIVNLNVNVTEWLIPVKYSLQHSIMYLQQESLTTGILIYYMQSFYFLVWFMD